MLRTLANLVEAMLLITRAFFRFFSPVTTVSFHIHAMSGQYITLKHQSAPPRQPYVGPPSSGTSQPFHTPPHRLRQSPITSTYPLGRGLRRRRRRSRASSSRGWPRGPASACAAARSGVSYIKQMETQVSTVPPYHIHQAIKIQIKYECADQSSQIGTNGQSESLLMCPKGSALKCSFMHTSVSEESRYLVPLAQLLFPPPPLLLVPALDAAELLLRHLTRMVRVTWYHEETWGHTDEMRHGHSGGQASDDPKTHRATNQKQACGPLCAVTGTYTNR